MPLKIDIQDALDNDALHDVRLIGTDNNNEVPCNKFVLAIRSPVFQRMFFGDYRERDSETVKLDYHSIVLEVLVKYCYSDVIDFNLILNSESSSLTDEEVTLLLDLRDAALYFEISGVADHVLGKVGSYIFHKGSMGCVCAALTSLDQRVESGSPFWTILCKLITNNPAACLLPKESQSNKGIKAVPASVLKDILENVEDAYVVTCCLKEWREENLETDSQTADEHEKLLTDLANGLDLQSIQSLTLATLKPCALFSKERLEEARSNQVETYWKKQNPFDFPILVSGAGLESVNGYFSKPNDFTRNEICFKKLGTFEEKISVITIKLIEGRWTICASENGSFGVGKLLYQAPKWSMLSFSQTPESSWTCIEGPSPPPYVVNMEPTKVPTFEPKQLVDLKGDTVTLMSVAGRSFEEQRLQHYNNSVH